MIKQKKPHARISRKYAIGQNRSGNRRLDVHTSSHLLTPTLFCGPASSAHWAFIAGKNKY